MLGLTRGPGGKAPPLGKAAVLDETTPAVEVKVAGEPWGVAVADAHVADTLAETHVAEAAQHIPRRLWSPARSPRPTLPMR